MSYYRNRIVLISSLVAVVIFSALLVVTGMTKTPTITASEKQVSPAEQTPTPKKEQKKCRVECYHNSHRPEYPRLGACHSDYKTCRASYDEHVKSLPEHKSDTLINTTPVCK